MIRKKKLMTYLNYSFWDCFVKCKGFTAYFRLFRGVQGLAEIRNLSVYRVSQRILFIKYLKSTNYDN